MRRTLAGLLFGIAYTCASLAFGGWLLQRTAFEPDRTADLAPVVLGDSEIKTELVDVIANAATPTLAALDPNITLEQVRGTVTQVASTPAGAKLMANILRDAHAHLIGEQDKPVQITGAQMVEVVRDERVAALPPVTLPVPRIGLLNILRQVLTWLVPIAAIAALAFGVVGMTTHPDRSALVRSLGFGLLLLAVLGIVLGYLIPRFLIPALSDNPWSNVPARLADDSIGVLIAVELLLIGGGLGLLVSSGMMRRRKRWSTPVSTYRYNEERRWS